MLVFGGVLVFSLEDVSTFLKNPFKDWSWFSVQYFYRQICGKSCHFWDTHTNTLVILESPWSYCWWTKSCTTKDDNYPIIYRVLTIPGGAGFLPSTVSFLQIFSSTFSSISYISQIPIFHVPPSGLAPLVVEGVHLQTPSQHPKHFGYR